MCKQVRCVLVQQNCGALHKHTHRLLVSCKSAARPDLQMRDASYDQARVCSWSSPQISTRACAVCWGVICLNMTSTVAHARHEFGSQAIAKVTYSSYVIRLLDLLLSHARDLVQAPTHSRREVGPNGACGSKAWDRVLDCCCRAAWRARRQDCRRAAREDEGVGFSSAAP